MPAVQCTITEQECHPPHRVKYTRLVPKLENKNSTLNLVSLRHTPAQFLLAERNLGAIIISQPTESWVPSLLFAAKISNWTARRQQKWRVVLFDLYLKGSE